MQQGRKSLPLGLFEEHRGGTSSFGTNGDDVDPARAAELRFVMMYWFGTDVGGWGYTLMIISMAAFWGLLITAFVLFTRSDDRSEPAPENLLAQRFARGEIDEAEFHDRRAALRGGVRL